MKELRVYRTKAGKQPFTDWLASLNDKIVRAQINSRLNRVALGNFGDYKSVGSGIMELRIHRSPGYRIYFKEHDNTIILLLFGGNKKTQKDDIQKAKEYWIDFKERYYD
ncbi:MAG: type II toxin-antitoxin system RelE/ParE family toxin [Legionellales bacterium]|nr:type II toxin-antitoxin system RelE/ParE family toxin [Legionellales bacterium]